MSLILDALNRAENERKNQKAVPDIGTLHTPIEITEATGSNKKLWVIAALIVVVGLIVAVWLFARGDQASSPSLATAVESDKRSEPVSTPDAAPATQQVSSAANAQIAVAKMPSRMADAPNTNLSSNVADSVDQLYLAPETAPEIDANINELYAAKTSEGSTPIVEPFANAETTAVVKSEPEVPVRTFASITNIPGFNDLPWNTRQSIPTITYARHNFLANGLSSVVINNQTVGVGNIISVGQFVVQEIYVDGVVLKHGNTQFKLRALNGWINM